MIKSKRVLLYVCRGGKIYVTGWGARKKPKRYCVIGGGAPVGFKFSNRVLRGPDLSVWLLWDRNLKEFVLSERGCFEASLL